MSRFPELTKDKLSPGISYACAYLRLKLGWGIERAISEPPKVRAPRLTYEQRLEKYAAKRAARHAKLIAAGQAKLYAWERADWNRACKKAVVVAPQNGVRSHPRIKQIRKHSIKSTSPARVQALVSAYCDQFIKTGELNPEIAAKLKEHADALRRPKCNSQRVPAEHVAQTSRPRTRDGSTDHGSGVIVHAAQPAGR
jgi:hypothetical protein